MFRSSNIVDINTALVRLQKMFTVQRTVHMQYDIHTYTQSDLTCLYTSALDEIVDKARELFK